MTVRRDSRFQLKGATWMPISLFAARTKAAARNPTAVVAASHASRG
jgi:hypothetical protein